MTTVSSARDLDRSTFVARCSFRNVAGCAVRRGAPRGRTISDSMISRIRVGKRLLIRDRQIARRGVGERARKRELGHRPRAGGAK